MLLPSSAGPSTWPVHVRSDRPACAWSPTDVALIQLLQDVRHVQRLCSSQMLPGAAQSCLLMHDPLMIWERPFVWGPCAEKRGISTLSLHVQHGLVPHPPYCAVQGDPFSMWRSATPVRAARFFFVRSWSTWRGRTQSGARDNLRRTRSQEKGPCEENIF